MLGLARRMGITLPPKIKKWGGADAPSHFQALAVSDGSFRGHGHHCLSGFPDVLAGVLQAAPAVAAEAALEVSPRALLAVLLPGAPAVLLPALPAVLLRAASAVSLPAG